MKKVMKDNFFKREIESIGKIVIAITTLQMSIFQTIEPEYSLLQILI